MSRADAVQQKCVEVEPQSGHSGHKDEYQSWAGQYSDDWWILAYYNEGLWNACFFKWDFHHEHASGSSFEEARSRAERRIDSIENEGLASVKPPSNEMCYAW
jgi:hypothetical protein